MIIPESIYELKDGRKLVLRSPSREEGQQLLDHMIITSGETYFMARYPEEFLVDENFMKERIQEINSSLEDFYIAAFVDGEFVGNCGLQRIKYHMKYMHRAGMGISIQAKVCNLGIGQLLIKNLINYARQTSFEQIELGVFSDNERAKHLYEKMGFIQTGIQPRAFKLKDGTYRDEIQMIYYL